MKKALIICAQGMSSSMMAMKTTKWFEENGYEISMDAVGVPEGTKMIESSDFDLFLISPQTKMFLKKFQEAGNKVGKPVVAIPPQAYVPIPSGIKNMGQLVLDNI